MSRRSAQGEAYGSVTQPVARALLGAWVLVSWRIHQNDSADFTEPFGDNPLGLLMYTADGWMSATVSRRGRPGLRSGASPRQSDPAELADAFRSYFHYAGTYRVQAGVVIHQVHTSLNPAMVGTEQVRHLQLEGDQLLLTGEERVGDIVRLHRLQWRRPSSPA